MINPQDELFMNLTIVLISYCLFLLKYFLFPQFVLIRREGKAFES